MNTNLFVIPKYGGPLIHWTKHSSSQTVKQLLLSNYMYMECPLIYRNTDIHFRDCRIITNCRNAIGRIRNLMRHLSKNKTRQQLGFKIDVQLYMYEGTYHFRFIRINRVLAGCGRSISLSTLRVAIYWEGSLYSFHTSFSFNGWRHKCA